MTPAMIKAKPKFKVGQIVMYRQWEGSKLEDCRPIKLVRRFLGYEGRIWWKDTWGNSFEEDQMRPQTRREKGD